MSMSRSFMSMSRCKKLLSVMLCLALLSSMTPITAYAAVPDTVGTETAGTEAPAAGAAGVQAAVAVAAAAPEFAGFTALELAGAKLTDTDHTDADILSVVNGESPGPGYAPWGAGGLKIVLTLAEESEVSRLALICSQGFGMGVYDVSYATGIDPENFIPTGKSFADPSGAADPNPAPFVLDFDSPVTAKYIMIQAPVNYWTFYLTGLFAYAGGGAGGGDTAGDSMRVVGATVYYSDADPIDITAGVNGSWPYNGGDLYIHNPYAEPGVEHTATDIVLELNGVFSIQGLNFALVYNYYYQWASPSYVYVSTDGINWGDPVASVRPGAEPYTMDPEISFAPVDARYIKIARQADLWIAFTSITVEPSTGGGGEVPDDSPYATVTAAIANGGCNADWSAALYTDKDILHVVNAGGVPAGDTYWNVWSSSPGPCQFTITLTLAKDYPIDGISLFLPDSVVTDNGSGSGGLAVYVSSDGVNWSEALGVMGESCAVTFEPVTAKYIKLAGLGPYDMYTINGGLFVHKYAEVPPSPYAVVTAAIADGGCNADWSAALYTGEDILPVVNAGGATTGGTYWNVWSANPGPCRLAITLTLAAEYTIDEVSLFLPDSQVTDSGGSGGFGVYVSSDGVSWSEALGVMGPSCDVTFAPVKARYVKLAGLGPYDMLTIQGGLFVHKYVSDGSVSEAPAIIRVSEGVGPGNAVGVYGEYFLGGVTVTMVGAGADGADVAVRPEQVDPYGQFLRFIWPENVAPGVYPVTVTTAGGTSKPVSVNKPDVRWASDPGVYDGMTLELYGRNLDASEYGGVSGTEVRFVPAGSVNPDADALYAAGVQAFSAYRLTVAAPNGFTPGADYTVQVRTNPAGLGGEWTDAYEYPSVTKKVTVTAAARPADATALALGVSWAGEFNWNVLSRLSPSGGDDTAAIQNALNAAEAAGGGVVELAAGTYTISDTVKLGVGVVLKGAGKNATVIQMLAPGNTSSGYVSFFTHSASSGYVGRFGVTGIKAEAAPSIDPGVRLNFGAFGDGAWYGNWDPNFDAREVYNYLTAKYIFLYDNDFDLSLENPNYGGFRCSGAGPILVKNNNFQTTSDICYSFSILNYFTFINNTFDYAASQMSVASEKFIFENNAITGHYNSVTEDYFHSAGLHGLFTNEPIYGFNMWNSYIGGNTIKNLDHVDGNDGEAMGCDSNQSYQASEEILGATENTITFAENYVHSGHSFNESQQLIITAGTGLGQIREVAGAASAGMDGMKKVWTVTVDRPWDVIPDGTSKVGVGRYHIGNTFDSNTSVNTCGGAPQMYDGCEDNIISNNTAIDTNGMYLHGWNLKTPGYGFSGVSFFNVYRNNYVEGHGPRFGNPFIGERMEDSTYNPPWGPAMYANEQRYNTIDKSDTTSSDVNLPGDGESSHTPGGIIVNCVNGVLTGKLSVGALFEYNEVKNSEIGIAIDQPSAYGVFLKDNSIVNVTTPIKDNGTNTFVYQNDARGMLHGGWTVTPAGAAGAIADNDAGTAANLGGGDVSLKIDLKNIHVINGVDISGDVSGNFGLYLYKTAVLAPIVSISNVTAKDLARLTFAPTEARYVELRFTGASGDVVIGNVNVLPFDPAVPTPAPAVVPPWNKDWAGIEIPRDGWAVTASKNNDDAPNVIDGDIDTYWKVSGDIEGDWIMIDLGSRYTLELIQYIDPESLKYNYPVSIDIYGAASDPDNPDSWRLLDHEISNSFQDSLTSSFFLDQDPPRNIRYVKLVCRMEGELSENWAIGELHIYGTPTPFILTQDDIVISSASERPRMVYNAPARYWEGDSPGNVMEVGQYLIFDLQGLYDVSKIIMPMADAPWYHPRSMMVFASDKPVGDVSGIDWGSAVFTAIRPTDIDGAPFQVSYDTAHGFSALTFGEPVRARYLKLLIYDVEPAEKGMWRVRNVDIICEPVEIDTPVPPAIDGPEAMTLPEGYAAASSAPFTITGDNAAVTKTGGDPAVTWNNEAKTLDIAAGLKPGVYEIKLTAGNGVSPDAVFTFTLTVLKGELVCAVKSMLAKVAKPLAIPFAWSGASGALSFTSSNPAVCGVSRDGTLTPMKAGIAVITIAAPDGTKVVFAVTVTA